MNSNSNKLLISFVAVIAIIAVIGIYYLSTSNAEIRTRNEYQAQIKANESEFDKVWKVIAQSAEVSAEERESFKRTYVDIMQATQGVAGKGALASFFTQAQIPISSELYSKLMTMIEAQRESFNRSQKKLIQLKMQHDNLRLTAPSSLVVGGRPELELVIVSSDKTREIFSTGTDNDVQLFPKK